MCLTIGGVESLGTRPVGAELAFVEPDSEFSQRSLLYTAVSRAKQKCVLFTSDEALQRMRMRKNTKTALQWELERRAAKPS